MSVEASLFLIESRKEVVNIRTGNCSSTFTKRSLFGKEFHMISQQTHDQLDINYTSNDIRGVSPSSVIYPTKNLLVGGYYS